MSVIVNNRSNNQENFQELPLHIFFLTIDSLILYVPLSRARKSYLIRLSVCLCDRTVRPVEILVTKFVFSGHPTCGLHSTRVPYFLYGRDVFL